MEQSQSPREPIQESSVGPAENPSQVLIRIQENRRLGESMDVDAFFDDIRILDKLGMTEQKKTSQLLRHLGRDPLIWTTLTQRLQMSDVQMDAEAVKDELRLASILGLDQLPNEAKLIGYLRNKYQIPTPEQDSVKDPGKRRLLKAAGALVVTALAGGLAAKTLGSQGSTTGSEGDIAPLTPEQPVNLFEKTIEPFVQEAYKKRAERARQDPEYLVRVDQELNQNRLNLVLFAYSEEHGETYENYGGFPTILSYDLKTGQIGIVHFSRDIRVPELERKFPKDSIENHRVRRIYKNGGFEGMREICERMSGLAIDYQIVLRDVVVRDAIQKLADGSLEIEVPKDHTTGPFRFDRVEYGDGFIPKGRQTMDTMRLIQYISAEDKEPGGKEDERSYRKNQVFEALTKKLKEKIKSNPTFLVNILNFIKAEISSRNTEIDFDLNLLTKSGQVIQGLISALIGRLGGAGSLEMKLAEINPTKQHVFHDSAFGDGGVTRVHHIKDNKTTAWKDKPEIFTKLQQEDLPFWMLIPDGGNPYAQDLIADYWQSTRKLVKQKLLG